ncbi:MAG: ribosome maturation factor RimP [Gemmatimonadetes bacterium]|nr:ribosome maturation factor RimP [Gemmatimonadota bacterium]
MSGQEGSVFGLLNPVVTGQGLQLVEITLGAASRRGTLIRIVIHSPEGVSHQDCSRVTRACAQALEDAEAFDGAYTLEVSSPGLGREMKDGREFEIFRGQPVRMVLAGGGERTGKCAGTQGEEVVLLEEDGTESVIPWSNVAKAKLVPEKRGGGFGGEA